MSAALIKLNIDQHRKLLSISNALKLQMRILPIITFATHAGHKIWSVESAIDQRGTISKTMAKPHHDVSSDNLPF